MLKKSIIDCLKEHNLHIATIQISYASGQVHISVADNAERRLKGTAHFNGKRRDDVEDLNSALEEAFVRCIVAYKVATNPEWKESQPKPDVVLVVES
jgi:hypothetical protein